MTKLRGLLETYALNFRMTQWQKKAVLDPFEEPAIIVERFFEQKALIDADRRLTPEGKAAARGEAGTAAIAAISKWHVPRVAGLDADLGVHRTALLPPSTEKPDPRAIDFLLSHLKDRTPQEIATFYNSATDGERLLMEHAAASVGRIPRKSEHGLEWQPLLNPETVNDSIIARAVAKNPQGAQKLQELTEIRAMHVTVAGHATQEVRNAMSE